MKLASALCALLLVAASGCAAPVDPVESQMLCVQDPECRARMEQPRYH